MIKTEYLLSIAFLFLLVLSLFSTFVLGGISSSTYNFFNVTNLTHFNWTSSNITIGFLNDTIQMNINNYTTYIKDEYNQKSQMSAETPNWFGCFPRSGSNNISFTVQNQTGSYTNSTLTRNNGSAEEFILSIHSFCPPGKYYGHFNVTRVGNASDIVEVHATIHVPLSLNNTMVQNLTDIDGYFKGTFSINDSYHSYYFNTSELNLENITGLTISLTGLSQDLDIFVFNSSGGLIDKSIEKGSSSEQILDLDLPTTPDMWEIRIYGNLSSNSDYRGDLFYSTLNITNATDSLVSSLDFGDLDANTTVSNNFTLVNEDDMVLTDVNQDIEIYHVQVWPRENQTKIFNDFLVPSFAQKIKVKINWTDEDGKTITDWNLYLRNPAGDMIGNSTDKFILSNATNATREEYVEFNGPFSSSNEGYWNITVQNITNATCPYSYYYITAYVWMDESAWISTNYTNGLDFNRSANYSYNITLNLTIPETQVLDGAYEGFLKYNNSQGWNTKLPILFNVSAGTLIINETLNNGTIRLIDNIGFNRLGSDALTLNVTFNNTGSHPIYYNYTTSNYLLTSGTQNISFSVESWPSNPINESSSGMIDITVSINTTNTDNRIGIYKGWIFFNTTNNTINSSSYPYDTYNLSLEVNLTNQLTVQIVEIDTGDGNTWIENISETYNITLTTKVFLINGTQLFDDQDCGGAYCGLNINNFTSSKMIEANMTSTTYSPTNIVQRTTGADYLCDDTEEKCFVNVTAPTSMKGGRYRISLGVEWSNNQSVLIGNTSYNYVVVKDTGLKLTRLYPSADDFSLPEGGNITYFNVSIVNYGPINPTGGTITFANSSECAATISPQTSDSNCSTGTPSGTSFTSITAPGNASSVCMYVWKITTGDVSASEDCDYTVSASNTSYGSLMGTLTVTNTSPPTTVTTVPSSSSTSGSGGDGGDSGTPSGTANYINIIDYPTSVSIEQGGSKVLGVTVNNTNKTLTQYVILDVKGINSSWYSVNPAPTVNTSVKLRRAKSYVYEVTFSIPGDATVGDYSAKFNATSFYHFKGIVNIYDIVLKDFTLKITPGAALKSEIESTLSSYTSDMNDLEQQINESRDQGYNISEVESLLNQLKTKINQANDYVDTGNYLSAYNLLDDIKSLINQTNDALTGLPITGRVGGILGDWWSWGKWVIVIAVVGTVAVFGYMLWPTKLGEKLVAKLGKPKPAPAVVAKEAIVEKKDKVAETFMKLKERWKQIKEKKEAEKTES